MAVSKETQPSSSLGGMRRFQERALWGAVVLAAMLSGCASWEQALAPDPALVESAQGSGEAGGNSAESSGSQPTQDGRGNPAELGKANRNSSASNSTPSDPSSSKTAGAKGQNSDTPSNSSDNGELEEGNRLSSEAQTFPDLAETPVDLQEQVLAVANLGVLTITETDTPEESPEPSDPAADATSDTTSDATSEKTADSKADELMFAPNQPATRRLYARWLLTANNAFYGDRPSLKLRLAPESSAPVFKDVKATDPDFEVIQGLAEAGIIPSALSGAQEQINFKPDKPLTREELLLWKLPLDVRGALPPSNLEAVKEAWGFQDASKISTPAQRAVLADYQNGDRAVTRRLFGYTTLFQPAKPVTRAEAAAALAYFGTQDELISAEEVDLEWAEVEPET